jgi:hypothetical protein
MPGAIPIAVSWAALFDGDPRWPVGLIAGAIGGVWLFFTGFRTWRQVRLIADTPTSKVRSLALGRVELRGRAQGKGELCAPLTGASCVYYRYLVEQEVRSNRRRSWRTLVSGSSEAWPFYLEDETGRVLVDPRGAQVELAPDLRAVDPPFVGPLAAFAAEHGIEGRGFLGMGKRLRFSEWHVAPGDALYLLGVAQERGGLVHERRVRIAEKLAALKTDAAALARLDTDGDGRVSHEEWDVARRLAVQDIELAGFEDRVVVAADAGKATPFLIADRDERGLLRARRWRAVGGVVGGALLSLFCWAGLLHRLGLLGRS